MLASTEIWVTVPISDATVCFLTSVRRWHLMTASYISENKLNFKKSHWDSIFHFPLFGRVKILDMFLEDYKADVLKE